MRPRLDRFINGIASGLALLGAIGVVVMLLHITAYVVLRIVLSAPIPGTVEIVSSYYMVVIAFLPLAWAERRGDMIAIDVFASFYRGGVGKTVDLFVALVTAATYLIFAYTTWLVAMREFGSGSFVISNDVSIPTWPAYFALPAGFALAAVVAIYKLAQIALPPAPPAEPGP